MSGVPGSGTRRRELAVVLARGASRRMGRPKGLLNLPEKDEPLVRVIAGLYRHRCPVVVVTLDPLVGAYEEALAGLEHARVMGCLSGGETALSVWYGWQGFEHREQVTHVWAHPVDLPLVSPATLDLLLAQSMARPEALIRPLVGDNPGHPVVIPVCLLAELTSGSVHLEGPFRDFIARLQVRIPGPPVIMVHCEDRGTVMDIDTPGDLRSVGERKE